MDNLYMTKTSKNINKPFRQAVMAVIIKDDNSFLIGASPRDGGYKFPQGGMDENETPLDCLYRELKEELGIQLNHEQILKKLDFTVKYNYPNYKPYSKIFTGQEMHVFVIKHHNSMTIVPQDDEFSELLWITKNQLKNFDFMYRGAAYFEAISFVI